MVNDTEYGHTSFEIKSTDVPLIAIVLKTNDLDTTKKELLRKFGPDSENADFFDNDGLVLDTGSVNEDISKIDLIQLIEVLKKCKLLPITIRSSNKKNIELALKFGLAEAAQEVHKTRQQSIHESTTVELVREVVREVPAPLTMVVDKPLRSGQKIYARGADLIVLAMVNQGAEVVADGNIHVYAPLRGKAMAGARGNTEARIFALCFEPELVSIAGVYRTSEHALPQEVQSKPTQVRLSNDGQEKLIIEPLKS